MTTKLPSRSPTVLFRAMDDGGVLFCSRTEVYFGLNDVGVRIWESLPDGEGAGEPSVQKLLDTLGSSYPEVAAEALAADVSGFLEALVGSELAFYEESRSA